MNTIHLTSNAGHSASFVDSVVQIALVALRTADQGLTRVADGAATWSQRIAARRALRALDDHILHDIGLSRADIEHEAGKRFWQD